MTAPRLRIRDVSKRFGATSALDGVHLEVRSGEVHALIGENGAGKSTLMKILSGVHPPDAGTLELDGLPYRPLNPHHARASGISMIYQELTLAPHLSVAENIVLGEEPGRWGWVARSRMRAQAREVLAELGHGSIPLDAPAGELPVAAQQIVEIARALLTRPRVVLMDEPTSSLTQADVEQLFKAVLRLKSAGVGVVYISHFLEECQRLCDRFTVLRDGRTVAEGDMGSTPLETVVRQMVGRDLKEVYHRSPRTPGAVVLELREIRGMRKPLSATLQVRAGEIFGIAGLIGAGRTETARIAFGLDRARAGTVACFGRVERGGQPARSLAAGVGMVSEDRKGEGLMLGRSVADNLMLTRMGPVARCGFVSAGRQRAVAARWIDRLRVRCAGPGQPVGELSGGNQQKVAIGRLLHHEARILLLDEPTRGIDVGSKAEIYRLLDELAVQGRAVLFISSYLPELLGVCDRIGVMCRGVLREVRDARDWTEHEIMAAAIGQGADSRAGGGES